VNCASGSGPFLVVPSAITKLQDSFAIRHATAKEMICQVTEEQYGKNYQEQRMDSHLSHGLKVAESYVERHPRNCQPAGPVFTAEHEYSANDGDQADDENPNIDPRERMPRVELGQVIEKSNRTHRNEQVTDKSY